MAKTSKTKTAKKRVKVGKLSTKTKLAGKSMKDVKGGFSSGVLTHESTHYADEKRTDTLVKSS